MHSVCAVVLTVVAVDKYARICFPNRTSSDEFFAGKQELGESSCDERMR